jgi:hypothetical protein
MFLSPQHARRNPKDVEYPGQPLLPGQIRLVRLLPGTWTDPIQCELFEEDHGTTKYEALSYVWGSQNVTRPIFLNRKEFRVTFNLEGALRHLREQFKDDDKRKVFWIDALCINQKDTEERTTQVQLMGDIYKMCAQVVVYLGDRLDGRHRPERPSIAIRCNRYEMIPDNMCDGDADLDIIKIFSLLQDLAQDKHLIVIPAFRSQHYPSEPHTNVKSRPNYDERSRLFESLRRMMQPPFTPWWSRVWVIQEVTVAPKVLLMYGTYSAPWKMVYGAALNYMSHSSFCCSGVVAQLPLDQTNVLADFCSRILGIAESRFRSGERPAEYPSTRVNTPQSLLDLLRKFRDRRASDPRDKVYALLSLAPVSRKSPPMIPDYSLSEVEVFRQATMQCMYEAESLSVLNSDLGRKFRNDLPSWVPDWSAPGGPTYEARAAIAELYDAMPFSGAEFEKVVRSAGKGPRGNAGLLVEALEIGKIVSVYDVMWGADTPSIWQNTLTLWKKVASKFFGVQHHGMKDRLLTTPGDGIHSDEGMEGFWRLICGDVIHRDQGIAKVWSRVRESDELTFMMWAMNSPKSPFKMSRTTELWKMTAPGEKMLTIVRNEDGIWSTKAIVWRNIQVLWPGQPILGPIEWIEDQPPGDLVPRGLAEHLDPDNKIKALLQFLVDNGADVEITKQPENGWIGLPWREILVRIRQHLALHYGNDKLDPEAHRKLIPNIDNSIMAVTLSRRLIVSDRHIGLGPADAREGDELFFLKGGKTPFVLRETSAQPDLVGPKCELVGDCYIQSLMDISNVAKDDSCGKWITITLV